jgi:hypothetical protein
MSFVMNFIINIVKNKMIDLKDNEIKIFNGV